MIKFFALSVCFFSIGFSFYLVAENTVNVKDIDKNKSVLARKRNSLKSIEELLRANNDCNNSYIDDLILRIQTTKEALANIVCNKNISKKALKNKIDKINKDMKDIVNKYNSLIDDDSTYNNDIIDKNVLPVSSKTTKGHAIVSLDWRKKLRFTEKQNPIQELTSPITEENVLEFIDENKNNSDGVLESKNIPDSDIGCPNVSTGNAGNTDAISIIDVQKILR